jgi:hypothetical protein
VFESIAIGHQVGMRSRLCWGSGLSAIGQKSAKADVAVMANVGTIRVYQRPLSGSILAAKLSYQWLENGEQVNTAPILFSLALLCYEFLSESPRLGRE